MNKAEIKSASTHTLRKTTGAWYYIATRDIFAITPASVIRMIFIIPSNLKDPSLILPYDRGDGQRIPLLNPFIFPCLSVGTEM